MADSVTTQWQDAFVTQLAVTANTTLVAAFSGTVRDVTSYPVAFVMTGLEDAELIETDLNRYDDWQESAHVLIQAKDPETVRMAIEKLQSLFKPFTSANALYALGVRRVRPRTKRVPDIVNPAANEVYSGEIVFDVEVRYTY